MSLNFLVSSLGCYCLDGWTTRSVGKLLGSLGQSSGQRFVLCLEDLTRGVTQGFPQALSCSCFEKEGDRRQVTLKKVVWEG